MCLTTKTMNDKKITDRNSIYPPYLGKLAVCPSIPNPGISVTQITTSLQSMMAWTYNILAGYFIVIRCTCLKITAARKYLVKNFFLYRPERLLYRPYKLVFRPDNIIIPPGDIKQFFTWHLRAAVQNGL